MRLRLAYHIVIVESFTSIADEVGSAEEGSGASTDFFNLRDGVGEGGCVDEDLLVESIRRLIEVRSLKHTDLTWAAVLPL